MNVTFSQISDICSVLGFLFTLLVLYKLRGIYRGFLAQARLPDLQKKIYEHRAALSQLLTRSDFTATGHEIETEIQKCHANLQSLQAKLGRAQVANVKALVALTKPALTPPNKEQVRKIYMALVGLEEELKNLSEDMKWRPRE